MTKIFKTAFAETGDKISPPDAVQPDGSVSYSIGYGFDYQRDTSLDGGVPVDPLAKAFPREQHNGILNDITAALGEIQANGLPIWQSIGGPYTVNALVRYSGSNWRSTVANNTTTPGSAGASWVDASFQPYATESTAGIIRISTAPEASAGTNSNTSMTPALVKSVLPVQATESVSGIAAIATTAMALAGTDDSRQMTALKARQAAEALHTSMIAAFPLSLPPAGWLKANGAAVSRTFYSRLFSVIGTDFGVGDGSTTFNLPDMRGMFPRAWDDGRGIDPGRVIGSKQKGSLIAYDPTTIESAVLGLHSRASDANTRNDLGVDIPVPSDYPNADAISILGSATYSVAQATGVARPVNTALLFCIKY